MTRSTRPTYLAAGLALCLAPAAPAFAQEFINGSDEYMVLRLGGITNRFDSSLRLDGRTTSGTEIQLENNNLERNLATFEAGFTYRFMPNHRLDFDYFGGERTGSKRYDTSITIGDSTYPIGATVSIKAESHLFDANYRYSIARDPTYEFALQGGFYSARFTYDVEAVANSGSNVATYRRVAETTLPLPLFGASLDLYPSPRWKLSGSFTGMKAKIGDVDGYAYVGRASAEWMATRNFGVGGKYTYLDVGADVNKDSFKGEVGVKTNSFSLYAKMSF
jgi:hypothetical protein